MSLSIGIIGLPNVGKSTLFNALVKGNLAQASNYPFTTIEPNVGIVEVPDDRLKKLAEIEKSEKIVPTVIEFVDIAGLVKGAHKGEGLGNKFLSHIREVDAIAMVIRGFKDSNIVHVEGKVDPKGDIETILTELALADLATIEKIKYELEKESKSGNKQAGKKLEIVNKIETVLSSGKPAINSNLNDEEMKLMQDANLLTLKPIIYVFNVDESDVATDPNKMIDSLGLKSSVDDSPALAICAKTESQLADFSESEKLLFLKDLGLKESGLEKLIKISYSTLNLITFLTAGVQEARAWTTVKGAKAPEAAGKIHTDFQEKFIKADVVAYQDFVKCNGWIGSKEAGKVRTEGKDYVFEDGDVVFIKHG